MRRYIEDGATYLANLLATSSGASWCMDKYTAIFRLALANDNRMCLCGIMSAELDDLPVEVRAERRLDHQGSDAGKAGREQSGSAGKAMAIFAAIEGAQLVARGCQDIGIYNRTIRTYRRSSIP